MEDQIRLHAVRVVSHIGVPEEERKRPQSLEVDLVLVPQERLGQTGDELAETIDYFAVWNQVQDIAAARPRKLIETLADDIAIEILKNPKIHQIKVEVRKFILPMTSSVAVTIWRERHIGDTHG